MRLKKEEQEKEALLNFLKLTQDGKFANIEKSSLSYIRIKEQREEPVYEEEYYYSVR